MNGRLSQWTCRLPAVVMAAIAGVRQAWGCATCFGRSDSPLAEGMNMGILVLLGVVLSVLAVLAGFFVFLGRRAAKAGPTAPPVANL